LTTLFIIAAVLAFGLGIWLGLPGRYDQSLDDIERIMAQGGRPRRKVKRRFTPLAWVQRKLDPRSGGGGRTRRGFHIRRPDE